MSLFGLNSLSTTSPTVFWSAGPSGGGADEPFRAHLEPLQATGNIDLVRTAQWKLIGHGVPKDGSQGVFYTWLWTLDTANLRRILARETPVARVQWVPDAEDRAALLVWLDAMEEQGELAKTPIYTGARVNEGGRIRYVKNLGWLLRRGRDVTELFAHRDAGSMGGSLSAHVDTQYGVVSYSTLFASFDHMLDWLDRPVFRGKPVTIEVGGRVFRRYVGTPGWRTP